MIRRAEQFRKIADNYDRLALAIGDQALRWVYLDFAQQWRDAAQRVEIVDVDPSRLSGRWNSAGIS